MPPAAGPAPRPTGTTNKVTGDPHRAFQETTGGLETVRLPRPQRLLAARAPPSTSSPVGARWSSPRLQDDHSRLAVAWLAALGETTQAAVDVFDKGVAAQGVLQRLRGRQRQRSAPQPKGAYRAPGGARALPGGRTHHLQALPLHHPGQERALRPNPVPLPGPAAPGHLHHRAP